MNEVAGWLGYSLDRPGGRIGVRGLGDRVLLLGRQAGRLASLYSYSAAEAGMKVAVLDVDGSVSPDVRGYYDTYDYSSMLYEAFRLEGEDAMHGQLVAGAYAAALDLTPEEEAILSAALQKLSAQNDLATPTSLYDALGGVEGFRGFYVDKLRGRIGALKLLDATRAEPFDRLTFEGALVDFSSAPYPQAAELAACMYVAKVLYTARSSAFRSDALLVTGAHRIFRSLTRFQHSGRLMAHLLEFPAPLVLATQIPALMNDRLLESMPVRVYSSEAWNARRNWKQAAALACSFIVCDDRSGASSGFAPRFVRPKRPAESPARPGTHVVVNRGLTRTILEDVVRFDTASRQSVVMYLSAMFLASDVEAELDRLHSGGFLILEPKENGSGPKIFAYTVTEAGRRLLRGMTE
ncbi:MAG: hypothetical protein JRN16_00730 [Nitrososphaerota archaeon]|nr:hypothetical protein [Nitrososphaerota archaeon]